MRVFEDYYFNLKKTVLFKDTKHLLDDFLAENGITYEGLCFDFESGNFEKLLQKYPVMQTGARSYRKAERALFKAL